MVKFFIGLTDSIVTRVTGSMSGIPFSNLHFDRSVQRHADH